MSHAEFGGRRSSEYPLYRFSLMILTLTDFVAQVSHRPEMISNVQAQGAERTLKAPDPSARAELHVAHLRPQEDHQELAAERLSRIPRRNEVVEELDPCGPRIHS